MKSQTEKDKDYIRSKLPKDKQPESVELQPVNMETRVPIRRDYTPDQRAQLKTLGVDEFRLDQMGALSILGEFARECGVIDTIKGCTFLSQSQLVKVMEKASAILDEGKTTKDKKTTLAQKLRASDVIVRAARALATVNTAAVKCDQTIVQVCDEVDQVRRRSFQPGMAVKQTAK